MNLKEHRKKAKDEIEALIRIEIIRHETTLAIENAFHVLRMEELTNIIINLDKRYPNLFIKDYN